MSTVYSTPARRTARLVTWAGGIMVVQGLVHLTITGFLVVRQDGPGWLHGELWGSFPPPGIRAPLVPPAGDFWLCPGSFGIPLLLLGWLVMWLGRTGVVVPSFVGWGIGLWGTVCGLIVEPTPFPTALVPAAMLVLAACAARRTARTAGTASPAPDTAGGVEGAASLAGVPMGGTTKHES